MDLNSPHLEMHIENLVLYGLQPGQRHELTEAIQKALLQLFIQRGIPPSLVENPGAYLLESARVQIYPDAKAEDIGAQVARSIYAGLSDSRNDSPESGRSTT